MYKRLLQPHLQGPALFLLAFLALWPLTLSAQESLWQKLDDGLQFAEFSQAGSPENATAKITVLRIDPNKFEFKLLTISEYGGAARNLEQWSKQYGLTAAINAGMFQEDLRTSVGYMKNYQHINNPNLNTNNCIFAFNPVDSTIAAARIIDRTCQSFKRWKNKYHSFIQSIRMISCQRKNVWQPQSKRWNIVCLSMDQNGNVLFIHAPAQYSVHDLIDVLLELPIGINTTMYLEGGNTAALYIGSERLNRHFYGDPQSNFLIQNGLQSPQPVPNVLGIVKKPR